MRKLQTILLGALIMTVAACAALPAATVYAGDVCGSDGKHTQAVETSIDIGCEGQGDPVVDMAFAIIRFLGAGVGLVITGSIVYGGLQYIGSRGDPNSTAMAIERLRNSVLALLLFIFAYAILGYIVPKGFIFR